MTQHQVIPEPAVEAAAKAIDVSEAEGCGCCADPKFTAEDDKLADKLEINVRSLLIAREVLEAAAPHMLAEAWEAGARTGFEVSREGFNGECAFEHCADDDYPPTNPHSGKPWLIDNSE